MEYLRQHTQENDTNSIELFLMNNIFNRLPEDKKIAIQTSIDNGSSILEAFKEAGVSVGYK